jgi:hypothetical protein
MQYMAKRKRATLFDSIRQLVLDSGVSCYEICKQTGIDKASLSRFVNGERGLSEDAMNQLANTYNSKSCRVSAREGLRRHLWQMISVADGHPN